MCSLCCSAARAGSHAAPAITGTFQCLSTARRKWCSAGTPTQRRVCATQPCRHQGGGLFPPRALRQRRIGKALYAVSVSGASETGKALPCFMRLYEQAGRHGRAEGSLVGRGWLPCAWLPCAWLPWPGRWPWIESRHGLNLAQMAMDRISLRISGESRANLQVLYAVAGGGRSRPLPSPALSALRLAALARRISSRWM